MRFSASMMKVWQDCSLQVKYKYEDKLEVEERIWSKTVFGTIIHAALEHYNNTGSVDEAKELFLLWWNDPLVLDENIKPINMWGRGLTYGGLRSRGVQILDEYHAKNQWENREVIATEHSFLVPLGEHWLSGYVDLLEVKKSARGKEPLRVVDYKSTSKQPYQAELALDIQFTIYTYASMQPEFWTGVSNEHGETAGFENGQELFERFADTERRAIWYHLWGNKEIDAGKRDDMDYLRLYRVMLECAKSRELDVYVPHISGNSCGLCDYVKECAAVGPVLDRLEKTIDLEEDEGAF